MEKYHLHQLLPEIIHHIQSFLNANEAAQSALISKSWLSAWHTRPNLDFSQPHFRRGRRRHKVKFSDMVGKSMQRYEQLRLMINSFRLDSHDSLHGNEWIVKAMKLGAVDVDIRLWGTPPSFALADELLGSKTLNRLSLTGVFAIDLLRLASSKLKSLCLKRVYVNFNENHDLFMDLLSRFPLLERLEFKQIQFPKFVKLEYDHHKLEYLHLESLTFSVDTDLIILSNSPCLKKLVIDLECLRLQNIRVRSKSLEHISIRRCLFSSAEISYSWETELDVPNIRKFKFEGYGWSRLVLKTTHREWESDIRLEYPRRPTPEWFIMLNKVLNDQFSLSRVSLSLSVFCLKSDCVGFVRAVGLPTVPPVVENFMVDNGRILTAAFLDALFLACRPKAMIVPTWRSSDQASDESMFELINKRVVVEKVFVEAHSPSCRVLRFHLRW